MATGDMPYMPVLQEEHQERIAIFLSYIFRFKTERGGLNRSHPVPTTLCEN